MIDSRTQAFEAFIRHHKLKAKSWGGKHNSFIYKQIFPLNLILVGPT